MRKKPRAPLKSTKVTSGMKLVPHPVPGKLYSVGSVLLSPYDETETIEVLSEKTREGKMDGNTGYEAREVLRDLPGGSIVLYIGPYSHEGLYHKVGLEDFFGLIEVGAVHFYDLGIPEE